MIKSSGKNLHKILLIYLKEDIRHFYFFVKTL
jgi:hypothetical protein